MNFAEQVLMYEANAASQRVIAELAALLDDTKAALAKAQRGEHPTGLHNLATTVAMIVASENHREGLVDALKILRGEK